MTAVATDPAFYNWLIQSQGMDPGQLAGGSVPGIDSLYNNYEQSVASGGISPGAYSGGNPGTTLGNESAGSGASYSNPGENVLTGTMIQPGGASGPMSGSSAPGGGVPTLQNALFGNPADAQPLPFSAFGSIPQISPTFTQPATIDPAVGQPGTALDPAANGGMTQGMVNQYEQAIQQSLAPTFQQQQQQQDQQLAARGIFNSSAAQDQATQLQGTQSATLAGAYAPVIAQQQGGQLSALSQNATAQNANANTGFNAYEQNLLANQNAATGANTFNATAANQATAGNAATQLGIEQGDQSQYNAFEQALLGYGNQTGQSELGALLNSYSPTGSNILGAGATSAGNAASSALQNYNGSGLSSGISNIFAGLGNAGNKSTGNTIINNGVGNGGNPGDPGNSLGGGGAIF